MGVGASFSFTSQNESAIANNSTISKINTIIELTKLDDISEIIDETKNILFECTVDENNDDIIDLDSTWLDEDSYFDLIELRCT
jgi:hypothetical protein